MNWRQAVTVGSAASFICLAACTSHLLTPFDPAATRAAATPALFVSTFHYGPAVMDVDLGPVLTDGAARSQKLQFLSYGDNAQPGGTVDALYYRHADTEARPLMIVLPLWGTHTYPPEKITAGLVAGRGGPVHVIRVLGEQYLFDWDALAASADGESFLAAAVAMTERMRVTVIDLRRLLDWAQTREEIDPDRIGVVGFSMSAVVGALLLGADERIRSAALVMGGAHLEHVIASCDGPLQTLREQLLPRIGWDEQRYRDELRTVFAPLNPAHYPVRSNPAGILMIDAYYDRCMPAISRDAYHAALGKPRRISYRYGHRMSFLAMTPLGLNTMRRAIFSHVRSSL